ncbi:hypothetical protein ANCDUO_10546 [Ancylostoma duodenale]|uniref:Uncharacterized protein n=1 Tax=Ancylostoma duodenale TaxID=51022 RepID=A0A0C2GDK5_9BILA|nr:hypothetical protein ANCDUO_10546 [Ancylostoma duodenale]
MSIIMPSPPVSRDKIKLSIKITALLLRKSASYCAPLNQKVFSEKQRQENNLTIVSVVTCAIEVAYYLYIIYAFMIRIHMNTRVHPTEEDSATNNCRSPHVVDVSHHSPQDHREVFINESLTKK